MYFFDFWYCTGVPGKRRKGDSLHSARQLRYTAQKATGQYSKAFSSLTALDYSFLLQM